jgi:GPH family glycoside/pentoside/hexuronide:cation symporter
MGGGRLIAYGLLGLPLAFAALPLYIHVPRLYATTGMTLSVLGGILLGARLLDACIDPWLGWLADRLPRRPLLAIALLPFTLGFVLLLHPPAQQAAPWLMLSLTLCYLGFSTATIAYQARGAEIGTSAATRTQLTAAREGFGLAGVLLAALLPSLLSADSDTGLAQLAWWLPGLVLIAAPITLCAGSGCTPAHNVRQPLGASLHRVMADPGFRRLLAVFVANGIAAALPATLFLFFVADVVQAEASGGPLLALYFIAGAASLPAWLAISERHGRTAAWLGSMLLAIAAFAGASQLGAGDIGAFALVCLASGLALGADLSLPAALAADIGRRLDQAGACFGVWNFFTKLNLALAAGLSLPLLGLLGYQPGQPPGNDGNHPAGLTALIFAYALLPLAFKSLAAGLLWRWRHSLESPA